MELFHRKLGQGDEEPMVCRLTAGAEWIRTFSPALDRQRFVGFVRVGADLPAHRSSEQLPPSAYRSICQGGGPRPPLTARIRRHHHVSAIGGASASRNRRFESVPLQRGVCELSVPCGASNFRFGSPATRRPLAWSRTPESDKRPRSTPRVLPAQTDLGFAHYRPLLVFARTKADRRSFVTRPERSV
jgi:hypothetical protein